MPVAASLILVHLLNARPSVQYEKREAGKVTYRMEKLPPAPDRTE